MRRTIKPFTVEVRSSRRKPAPAWPIIEDQPMVEWPAALLEELRPVPVVAPAEPPRRVLPALDERPKPTSVATPARLAEPKAEPISEPPPGLPKLEERRVLVEPEVSSADPVPEP